MFEEMFEEYSRMDLILMLCIMHMLLSVILAYILSDFIIKLIYNRKTKKNILEIIKNKKIDINTYIYNTKDYNEYIFESKHLEMKYILSEIEYNKLCKYFKDIKE